MELSPQPLVVDAHQYTRKAIGSADLSIVGGEDDNALGEKPADFA